MKFNLSSKIGRLLSNAEAESIGEAPEVSEPVFWLVFSLTFLIAALCVPLRRWL